MSVHDEVLEEARRMHAERMLAIGAVKAVLLMRARGVSATVIREEDLYIARCAQPELASQGRTEHEALVNLGEALELLLDDDLTPPAAAPAPSSPR